MSEKVKWLSATFMFQGYTVSFVANPGGDRWSRLRGCVEDVHGNTWAFRCGAHMATRTGAARLMAQAQAGKLVGAYVDTP